jgi:Na+/H+ antiporter NhaD/arsenite permease-like protein
MTTLLIVLFVITYLAIALEHMLHINKSASALLGAGLLWTIYAVTATDPALVSEELGHTVAETAQIIFFLIGAMTIVEVVDAHNGFDVVTARVQTKSLAGLLCLIAFITFFLSAILDNLTTTIVMVSLVRKLLKEHEERLFFAGMIVIAANAGGAWSPIGDVTTTMLWIGGQITAIQIIKTLFIPSLVSLLIPLAITGWMLRGRKVISPGGMYASDAKTTSLERNTMFFLGLGVLTAVPAFKTATPSPPFHGSAAWSWPGLAGRRLIAQKQDCQRQTPFQPGSRTVADRSGVNRVFHRNLAGGRNTAAQPCTGGGSRMAGPNHRQA